MGGRMYASLGSAGALAALHARQLCCPALPAWARQAPQTCSSATPNEARSWLSGVGVAEQMAVEVQALQTGAGCEVGGPDRHSTTTSGWRTVLQEATRNLAP